MSFLTVVGVVGSQAPIRRYGTADGLPSNDVTRNRRDSHGFVWFCTSEGLSRFDGYTFVNYGVEQGLPDPFVTDFIETRRGDYWVGTARGVANFNPQSGKFTVVATKEPQRVNSLLEDRNGTIWVAVDGGISQLVRTKGGWSLREIEGGLPTNFEELMQDAEGSVWASAYDGNAFLWRYSNGQIDLLRDPFLLLNRIVAMVQDRQGTIWLSTYHGLAQLTAHPQPRKKLVEHSYGKWDGQTRAETGDLFVSSDGRLFVAAEGRYEVIRGSLGEVRFRLLDRAPSGFGVQDGDGNFWWGNIKTVRSGFVRYGSEDGLGTDRIKSIFEGHDGQLYVVGGIHNRYIYRLDGDHFTAVVPKMPEHDASWDWQGWGWGQIHLQDRDGEWWVATGYGVLRYPKVNKLEDLAQTSPKAFYRTPYDVFRLYEDTRGDIWIASWDGVRRWDRATERVLPASPGMMPTAFREDRSGNMWIGCWTGGLLRQHAGHVEWIIRKGDTAVGTIFSLLQDHAGRMWAGTTRGGLLRIDYPEAEHPQFKTYSTKEGLSSNNVRAITEDHFGRIYFWTSRGVDRLDPETGKVRRYTEAEGLGPALADSNVAFCDHQGRLWFGLNVLSRFDPQPDRPPQPPPIRITRIQIHGVDRPISALGENNLSGLILQPSDNQVQIEFASLNLAAGDVIKYQYKLEGADGEWSPASDLRIVNYPRLSSGSYRFLVRAVNADGLVSPAPASVAMRLLPPIWRRWWFLTVAGLLTAALVYQLYRYRVEQLLVVERVRTRIATDLHDDIGSSLTQIAIMSELATRNKGDERAGERLARIANLARDLVDSMGDIVWAINPNRDHLSDLIQRMRHFATEVMEAADIDLRFVTSPERGDVSLQADVRREVFLVFKESLNNIVRHAQCRRVEIEVNFHGAMLVMKICDDGLGFPTNREQGSGHGLVSMRTRAERLGGTLEVNSEPGRGAAVTLNVPVGRSAFSKR